MLVIKPLKTEYLEEAAVLFTTNYQLLRKDIPFLPEKYQCQAEVVALLKNMVAERVGLAAFQNNELVGYMGGGYRIPYFKGTSYGVFCPEWGHAAGSANKKEIYHRLYRELSRQWVAGGCFTHALSFLAPEQTLLDTFVWFGFGRLVADAVRPLDRIDQTLPIDVTIRRATPNEAPIVTQLETALNRHLAGPPIFLCIDEQEKAGALEKALAAESKKVWLALVNNEPVAFIQAEASSFGAAQIVSDVDTISMTGAYTRPEQRGRGIAVLLLNQLLAHAAEQGLTRCSVDFETANPEARHFWLTHFTPVCYSVIRHIDENIAWTNNQFDVYTPPERMQS